MDRRRTSRESREDRKSPNKGRMHDTKEYHREDSFGRSKDRDSSFNRSRTQISQERKSRGLDSDRDRSRERDADYRKSRDKEVSFGKNTDRRSEDRKSRGKESPRDRSRDRNLSSHRSQERRTPRQAPSQQETPHFSPERKLNFDHIENERDNYYDDRDEEKENKIEESAVDRQLRLLNEERRKHLLKKEQISKKIESKTRELDFIRGLDSDDVVYMMYKKDLYAARVIQRWWRVRKMQRIFTKETHLKIQMIKAAMKIQKAWRLRKRRIWLGHYQKAKTKRVDHFYDPISDDKLKTYEDRIKSRCRTFTLAELGEQTPEELEREYIAKYRHFYDNYIENELTRRKANWLTHQIDDMLQFLSDDGKVSNLRIWGYDGSTSELYLQARKLNEKKIETALSGRLFLHEDDDLDIEGDRLLREIRAFKSEMVANHFY